MGLLPGFRIKRSIRNGSYWLIHDERGEVIFGCDKHGRLSHQQLLSHRYFSFWKEPTIPYNSIEEQRNDRILLSKARKRKNSPKPKACHDENNNFSVISAVTILQAFFRMLKAQSIVKELVHSYFIKVIDVSSKFFIYIDQRNGNSQFFKPFGLGCNLEDDLVTQTTSNDGSNQMKCLTQTYQQDFFVEDFQKGPYYHMSNGKVERNNTKKTRKKDDVEKFNFQNSKNIINNKFNNGLFGKSYSMIKSVKKMGKEAMIDVMRNHEGDIDIVVSGLRELSKLDYSEEIETKASRGTDQTIDYCLDLILFWRGRKYSLDVQNEAMNVLITISLQNPTNRDAINRTNWLDVTRDILIRVGDTSQMQNEVENSNSRYVSQNTLPIRDFFSYTYENNTTEKVECNEMLRKCTSLAIGCCRLLSTMSYEKERRASIAEKTMILVLDQMSSNHDSIFQNQITLNSCIAVYNMVYQREESIDSTIKIEYKHRISALLTDEEFRDEELNFFVQRLLLFFQ